MTERKFKLRWLFLALALPLFAVFAAFGTAPEQTQENIAVKTVVEEVSLPLLAEPYRDEEFWQIDYVHRDDTLASLFKRMAIRDDDALRFLTLSPDAHAINNVLTPGRSIEVKTDKQGKLLHLEYELDDEHILVAGLTADGYVVAKQRLILENHPALRSAMIVDSYFDATDDAGIPDQIALQIADIFSGEIDFNEDLQPGDQLNVIYEAFYNAGELMKLGNVLAVELVNRGKAHQAIHYGETKGRFAYYTPDGKSLHKSFLRSPVEFSRVSSSFNRGRFHPILHRFKAHKGVDLAAPIGTRIKAAGEGVVDFIGYKGGYGKVVVLQHDNNIRTVYGHLSGFAPGLMRGQQVNQGDIIGFVGMTGLATGPHLHYEFLVNGLHHDPMTVALPTSIPIEEVHKKDFAIKSQALMAEIGMLNRRRMVANNDRN